MSQEESANLDTTIQSWHSMVRRLERRSLEKALAKVGDKRQTMFQNPQVANRFDLPKATKPEHVLGVLNELKSRGFSTLAIDGSNSFQRRTAIYGEALGFQTNITLAPHEKALAKQLAEQRRTLLERTSGPKLGRVM